MNKDELTKLYMQSFLNKIIKGDCLEVLPSIPASSIDLALIDPPYNIAKDEWDKFTSTDAYIEFMGAVFLQLERTLKDRGSLYFFHNDFNQIVKLYNWIEQNTQLHFKQLITWNKIDPSFKNYGFVQQRLSISEMRNYYNGFTEYCLFYVKTDDVCMLDDPRFFAEIKDYMQEQLQQSKLTKKQIQQVLGNFMGTHYFSKKSQWGFPSKENYEKLQTTGYWQRPWEELKQIYDEQLEGSRGVKDGIRHPFHTQIVKEDLRANSNVWLYPPAKYNGHMTPKPVELLNNIIKHSTDEGDIVLDCFGGSGSTAVACLQTNRQYILIEKEQKYIDITNSRIEEEQCL